MGFEAFDGEREITISIRKVANGYVLRMHRPEIDLARHSWNDAEARFTSEVVGRYRHTDAGWKTATDLGS